MSDSPKPSPRLSLNTRQSRELVKFARMLEVRPEQFLQWVLADHLENLADPGGGWLTDWAHDLIKYDTPEQAERVRTRVERWSARRRAARQIEETMERGNAA